MTSGYNGGKLTTDVERELLAVLLVPATVVDGWFLERWTDVARSEGAVAKLAWSSVLEDADADHGGVPADG